MAGPLELIVDGFRSFAESMLGYATGELKLKGRLINLLQPRLSLVLLGI
jgi:hypothetical protein